MTVRQKELNSLGAICGGRFTDENSDAQSAYYLENAPVSVFRTALVISARRALHGEQLHHVFPAFPDIPPYSGAQARDMHCLISPGTALVALSRTGRRR